MKQVFWIRRIHKWLALAAGIQISIWAISGLYMTVVDLDIIHGDHLVKQVEEPNIESQQLRAISPELIKELAPVQSITLKSYFGMPVYEIRARKKNTLIVDAQTGELKQALTKEQVKQNALQVYAGDDSINKIELLSTHPGEIGGRKLPVWRVEYDDLVQSTLYFHHTSGQLLSKRTHLWRAFDVLWVLHIMDFLKSKGHRGYLFRFFSITSLLLAIFGAWLLFFRLQGESK